MYLFLTCFLIIPWEALWEALWDALWDAIWEALWDALATSEDDKKMIKDVVLEELGSYANMQRLVHDRVRQAHPSGRQKASWSNVGLLGTCAGHWRHLCAGARRGRPARDSNRGSRQYIHIRRLIHVLHLTQLLRRSGGTPSPRCVRQGQRRRFRRQGGGMRGGHF